MSYFDVDQKLESRLEELIIQGIIDYSESWASVVCKDTGIGVYIFSETSKRPPGVRSEYT